MRATILEGDVFDLLPTIAPGGVDAACYSPPYWALRSYLPRDHPRKHLELGSEPTPAEFVRNQIRVLRLVRECLADHGTVWVNIGDSYSSNSSTGRKDGGRPTCSPRPGLPKSVGTAEPVNRTHAGIDQGNLCLVPQRLAIAACDDGWIVRSVVVWRKPSAMPASVAGWRWQRCRVKVKEGGRGGNGRARMIAEGTSAPDAPRCTDAALAQWSDCPGCPKCIPNQGYVLRRGGWRPTSSWEPILMLAKSPRYFADGEPVKTPGVAVNGITQRAGNHQPDGRSGFGTAIPWNDIRAGANARDVQSWSSEPLPCGICGNPACRWFTSSGEGCAVRDQKRYCPKCGAGMVFHYAAFPSALAEFCLRAATSAHGYCRSCSAPWVRVVERDFDEAAAAAIKERRTTHKAHADRRDPEGRKINGTDYSRLMQQRTTGWRPSCGCFPCEPRRGIVLDPFAGSGRVGLACQKLGLDFLGCELNPEYAAMARRLLAADAPLFDEVT
jgi:DNA modification methylase